MFNKKTPPQGKSIEQQAGEIRKNELTQKIKKIAERISANARKEIWDANLEISLYNVIMEAVKRETDNWFNQQINAKKIQDIITKPNDEA